MSVMILVYVRRDKIKKMCKYIINEYGTVILEFAGAVPQLKFGFKKIEDVIKHGGIYKDSIAYNGRVLNL